MSDSRGLGRIDRRTLLKQSVAVPAALGGVAGLSAGRGNVSAGAQESGEKVVRMNTTVRVGNQFNPLWFIGTGSQWHSFPFIWTPLVFYNANGQMEPWLAESIDISPDARVYTFSLHANARWSDGTPITASDVKFSYELLSNPAAAAIGSPGIFPMAAIAGASAYVARETPSIEGIEIVDDQTVRFTLETPNALFLFDCYAFVMPKHILEGVAIEDLPNHPYVADPTVTSGPFRLANYEPQQFIELEAWPEYWGAKKPKIDRLVLVQVDGPAVMNSLETGELDLGVYLGTEDADRLERMETVEPIFTLSSGFQGIYVNGRREYLQDRRVRQAMLYAIDRGPLNDLLHQGQAVPIYSQIIGPEWAVNPNLNTYEYNTEMAEQLLQEVGWDFDRTLVYWTEVSPDPLAVYLQEAFRAIGLKVEIDTTAFAVTTEAFEANTFDLAGVGGGLMALDPDFASQLVTCSSSRSEDHGYCNPELDALFEAGAATTDQAERQEIYWQAAEILNRDQPYVDLFRPPTIYAVSERLTGFEAPIGFRFANTSVLDWDVAE